jgi:hypothetical protein
MVIQKWDQFQLKEYEGVWYKIKIWYDDKNMKVDHNTTKPKVGPLNLLWSVELQQNVVCRWAT